MNKPRCGEAYDRTVWGQGFLRRQLDRPLREPETHRHRLPRDCESQPRPSSAVYMTTIGCNNDRRDRPSFPLPSESGHGIASANPDGWLPRESGTPSAFTFMPAYSQECAVSVMRRRSVGPNPGHSLPLRGKTRPMSSVDTRADLAVRGFASSAATCRRSALSDGLFRFL